MDTDDLTEMAWDVIVRAAHVSDTLKAELGAMASRFKSENEWLRGVRAHLEEILRRRVGVGDGETLPDNQKRMRQGIEHCIARDSSRRLLDSSPGVFGRGAQSVYTSRPHDRGT